MSSNPPLIVDTPAILHAGDDYLEGGIGSDTYNFSGNFGKDVVFDSDGLGSIKLGPDTLAHASGTEP